jgi:hypothetical protein
MKGDESSDNPKQRREDETRRIVRARRQEPGNDAGDETDDDDPENMHAVLRATRRSTPPWSRGSIMSIVAAQATAVGR